MPEETLEQQIDTEGLRRCLSELASGQDEFNRGLVDWFDRLEQASLELLDQQRQWWTRQQEERESVRLREEALQQREKRLAELEQEIAQRRQELAQREAAPIEAAGNGSELLARLEELTGRWDELQQRLEQLPAGGEGAEAGLQRIEQWLQEAGGDRDTLHSLAETIRNELGSFGDLGGQLQAVKEDLQQAMQQMDSRLVAIGERQPGADQEESIRELEAKVRGLQEELSAAEQDRIALETELEVVRNRAAELLETLSEQRRQMAEERAHWSGELKRLRRLMEVLLDRQIDAAPEYESGNGQSRPKVVGYEEQERSHPAAASGAGDPVLDSVTAQFEVLQKDLSRRRRNNTG